MGLPTREHRNFYGRAAHSSPRDLVAALLAGFAIALLGQAVLDTAQVRLPALLSRSALLLLIPLGAAAGVALAAWLQHWLPVVFQIAKFGLVGLLSTTIDLAVLNVLMESTETYRGRWFPLLKAASFLAALCNAFLWNRNWTFCQPGTNWRHSSAQQFSLYAMAAVGGLILNVTVASLFVNLTSPPPGWRAIQWANVAALAALVATATWDFLCFKFIVFRSAEHTDVRRSAMAGASEGRVSCVVCHARITQMPVVRIAEAQLHRCDSCGGWTYLPRPTPSEQAQLHDTDEYFDHPYFRARREDKLAAEKRCQQVFARLEKVAGLPSVLGQRLLDIGCDTGSFLSAAAQAYGVVPFGLDVSRRAVEVARSRGLHVQWGRIEEAPLDFTRFKVVTAIDVIEHVVDPATFLQSIHARMEPGGALYVQTPNIASAVYQWGRWLCRLTRGHPRLLFDRLFPAQHLQYFGRKAMASLGNRCGFQLVGLGTQILPASDLEVSWLLVGPIMGLQLLDSWKGEEILIWAVLRKAE